MGPRVAGWGDWDDKRRSSGPESVRSHSELWKREKLPRMVDSSAECIRVWALKPHCLGSSHSLPFVTQALSSSTDKMGIIMGVYASQSCCNNPIS